MNKGRRCNPGQRDHPISILIQLRRSPMRTIAKVLDTLRNKVFVRMGAGVSLSGNRLG